MSPVQPAARWRGLSLAAGALAFLAMSDPVAAHHVMEGKIPATFFEGLLSGLGHPVIGIDHLAFLVGVGIAVAMANLSILLPAIFVIASALGVALHVQGVSLLGGELVVAGSVVAIGTLTAGRFRVPQSVWLIVFATAGLFHGHAYGEGIFGAEQSPLFAYLAGLIFIQTTIATGTALLIRRRADVSSLAPRLAGAVVAGIGLATLAGQIIPTISG
jgi:urease accessory protein